MKSLGVHVHVDSKEVIVSCEAFPTRLTFSKIVLGPDGASFDGPFFFVFESVLREAEEDVPDAPADDV